MRGAGSLDRRGSRGWEGRAQARAACAWKGLPLAGPSHKGLALSPDTPQKTPQTIPSYLAKAHFFKVRRLQQQKEEGPMEGERGRAVGGRGRPRQGLQLRSPGRLLEAAAHLTRHQACPGPWVPTDLLARRSVRRPRAGPSAPQEDDSSPRLERARAAPARPPAQRPDQWKCLNLKVPLNSPPTPHVQRCHGNAHPAAALVPTVQTNTHTRENCTDESQHSESPRGAGALCAPGARGEWGGVNHSGRLEAVPWLLREAWAVRPGHAPLRGARAPLPAPFLPF